MLESLQSRLKDGKKEVEREVDQLGHCPQQVEDERSNHPTDGGGGNHSVKLCVICDQKVCFSHSFYDDDHYCWQTLAVGIAENPI